MPGRPRPGQTGRPACACEAGSKTKPGRIPPRRGSSRFSVCTNRPLAFGELEALAGTLAAVLLAFLHAAVAGEKARVAQLLGHAVGCLVLALAGGGQPVHLL